MGDFAHLLPKKSSFSVFSGYARHGFRMVIFALNLLKFHLSSSFYIYFFITWSILKFSKNLLSKPFSIFKKTQRGKRQSAPCPILMKIFSVESPGFFYSEYGKTSVAGSKAKKFLPKYFFF